MPEFISSSGVIYIFIFTVPWLFSWRTGYDYRSILLLWVGIRRRAYRYLGFWRGSFAIAIADTGTDTYAYAYPDSDSDSDANITISTSVFYFKCDTYFYTYFCLHRTTYLHRFLYFFSLNCH